MDRNDFARILATYGELPNNLAGTDRGEGFRPDLRSPYRWGSKGLRCEEGSMKARRHAKREVARYTRRQSRQELRQLS